MASDQSLVSVGARDEFGDSIGSLAATAVLIRSPANADGMPYVPTRIDFLLQIAATQTIVMSDYAVALYSDDNSTDHYPGSLLGTPISLQDSFFAAPLVTTRSKWLQVPVVGVWPVMATSTYFWIVIAPTVPVALAVSGSFGGVLWTGLNSSVSTAPPATNTDRDLFTARELISQRFFGDTQFSASTTAAVSLVGVSVHVHVCECAKSTSIIS
jgi:hypothetical protein